jgi:hypothetical protein
VENSDLDEHEVLFRNNFYDFNVPDYVKEFWRQQIKQTLSISIDYGNGRNVERLSGNEFVSVVVVDSNIFMNIQLAEWRDRGWGCDHLDEWNGSIQLPFHSPSQLSKDSSQQRLNVNVIV